MQQNPKPWQHVPNSSLPRHLSSCLPGKAGGHISMGCSGVGKSASSLGQSYPFTPPPDSPPVFPIETPQNITLSGPCRLDARTPFLPPRHLHAPCRAPGSSLCSLSPPGNRLWPVNRGTPSGSAWLWPQLWPQWGREPPAGHHGFPHSKLGTQVPAHALLESDPTPCCPRGLLSLP